MGMRDVMSRIDLSAIDPADAGGLQEAHAQGELEALRERLADLQDRLFAEEERALLIVLQGMDASGKDSVISKLLNACDPSGLRVHNFKKPAGEEAAHDFLWRFHQQTPARGMIQVFDRSHYEEVIFPRVHELVDDEHWKARLDSINDFERLLGREGTVIVKLLMHVSEEEQGERIRQRLEKREKHADFSAADVKEREYWDAYQRAFQDVLDATNSDWAPWHVVPADNKWYVPVAAGRVVVAALEEIDPQYPDLDPEEAEEAGVSD
jgi:PPK2 family polyphosphate:nucleotide phosphotransferase